MDVSPWVEFGLAGLFGVFAVIVIRQFLAYLDKQNEQWRHHLYNDSKDKQQIVPCSYMAWYFSALNRYSTHRLLCPHGR